MLVSIMSSSCLSGCASWQMRLLFICLWALQQQRHNPQKEETDSVARSMSVSARACSDHMAEWLVCMASCNRQR
jgi:hypothetical protein